MALDQTQAENSQSRDSANAGDKVKLYAGKFKTPEELEAGYSELEKGFHATRQEVSQLRQTIETRIPERSEGDYGRGSGGYAPVHPEADQAQAAQVLARFYQDPIGVLREVKDTAAQEAEQRVSRRQREEANNRERVQTWLGKNPDLVTHSDLLDYHVRQTDGRLAVESRLDAAAGKVRERLRELRGTPGSVSPNPTDYIPGPSGMRDGGQAQAQTAAPAFTAESELASYAASRNTGRMKIPGRHGRT